MKKAKHYSLQLVLLFIILLFNWYYIIKLTRGGGTFENRLGGVLLPSYISIDRDLFFFLAGGVLSLPGPNTRDNFDSPTPSGALGSFALAATSCFRGDGDFLISTPPERNAKNERMILRLPLSVSLFVTQ